MIFNFIKELIITNPIKLTYIFLISIMMGFGIKLDDITIQKPLDTSQDYKFIKRGNTYFIPIFKEDSPRFFETSKIEKVTFEENFISYKEVHPIVIVSYLMSLILFVILIGISLTDDRDVNWEIKRIYKKCKLNQIKCDEENGEYFYHLDGRLIYKSHNQLRFTLHNSILDEFLESPNQFPKYEGTKKEIRDKKLNSILS